MQNLELLLVDHNALGGYLPEVWGSLRQLRILAVGAAGPLLISHGWAPVDALRCSMPCWCWPHAPIHLCAH